MAAERTPVIMTNDFESYREWYGVLWRKNKRKPTNAELIHFFETIAEVYEDGVSTDGRPIIELDFDKGFFE